MLQLLSVLLFALSSTASESHIRVPDTLSVVMIDGVLSKAEWQRAARVEVPGIAELYFQRSHEFVYLAVEYTHAPSGIVDLYVSPAQGEIYNLHASAKLGERQMRDGTFPEWIGGTIITGLRMYLAWTHSKSARFCLRQSVNFRFGWRVSPPLRGVCALNLRPWEPTMKWERLLFSRKVRRTIQPLDGWCWISSDWELDKSDC